jgi:hypothetical protein
MTEQAIALPPPDFPADTESYTDATMRECVRQAVLADRQRRSAPENQERELGPTSEQWDDACRGLGTQWRG